MRPEARVAQALPHASHQLALVETAGEVEPGERFALLFLDRAYDLEQQAVLRPEVVDEHPVARADGLRELPQAYVPESVLRDVLDRGIEQPLPRGVGSRLLFHAEDCTVWYMYQAVQNGRARR